VILTDDMGFNDVSYYNGGAADGTLQTPHIDAIGREGVVFANGYAGNATCAPSRAAIMTGRYGTRFGFEFTPMFKVGYTIFDLMTRDSTDPYKHRVDLDLAAKQPPMVELGLLAELK
jgi:arylsulfatase A-like enzyme